MLVFWCKIGYFIGFLIKKTFFNLLTQPKPGPTHITVARRHLINQRSKISGPSTITASVIHPFHHRPRHPNQLRRLCVYAWLVPYNFISTPTPITLTFKIITSQRLILFCLQINKTKPAN